MSVAITRHYVPGPYGELHLRSMELPDSGAAPLLCLHPAPYSGLYFETLMPLLTAPSQVVAPDYPGYGGSRGPGTALQIQDYAAAMLDVAAAVSTQPVDLLGFHTGCLVAVEMTLQSPQQIGRLILIDVPFFAEQERKAMRKSASLPPGYTADLGCLAKSFNFNIVNRMDHVSFERSFALFVEQLRSGNDANFAFNAAFSYDAATALARIAHPGRIIATGSNLAENTRAAAALMPSLELIEVPEITRSVFEEGAEIIAQQLNAYLAAD